MSDPTWLQSNGSALDSTAAELSALRRFFDVIAPAQTQASQPMPVLITRSTGAAGQARSWEGTADLWDAEGARFALSVDAAGKPVSAWAAKPVELVSGITLPGVSTDVFWQILSTHVPEEEWILTPGEPPMLPMASHLVGVIELGRKRVLTRVTILGDALSFDFAFDGKLTDIELAAMGSDAGPLHALEFADLVHLFGTGHDPTADLDWLPEELRGTSLASLKSVRLRVDPDDDRKLVQIGATVGIGGDTAWQLVPGFDFLKLDGLQVAFDVDHPLDPSCRLARVGVSGLIELGKAKLAASARWPDLAVNGALLDGDVNPIELADVLDAVHLPPLGASALKINYLAFEARPTGKQERFSVQARATDVLSIPVGSSKFEVQELDIGVALERGEHRSLSLDVSGKLAMGGAALWLSASCDHGGTGWTLEAWTDQPITFSQFQNWINGLFGVQALPASLNITGQITNVSFSFQTALMDASFHLAADFNVTPSAAARLELDLGLVHSGSGPYAPRLGGRFVLGGKYEFDLLAARDGKNGSLLAGAYVQLADTTVGDLLAALGITLPIPVKLEQGLVAYSGGRFLCAIELQAGFDLSQLPWVGRLLPAETFSLDLRIVAGAGAWNNQDVTDLNGVLPQGFRPFEVPAGDAASPVSLPRLETVLTLGDNTLALPNLGIELDQSASASPAAPGAGPAPLPVKAAPTAGSDVQWVPLQRSFGPVHLRRVGIGYDKRASAVAIALDGDLSLGPVTLSLDGLEAVSPLDKFDPSYRLRGLGLSCVTSEYELAGAFLKTGEDQFAGAAILRAQTVELSAFGAYREINGWKSLFVYAVLNYPLGGPAFFFVTGLAAGFGYNRKLTLPAIDEVAAFPLVRDAAAGASGAALPDADGLTAKLESIERYVPASEGDFFLAAGVRFSTFKILDSFVLAALSIGTAADSKARLDLIGLSTLVAPAPEAGKAVAPLAQIQIAILAQFVPQDGFLGIEARLTSASFLFSKNCHLSGGCAFYSWFHGEHAGDFVVTVGGYHPQFTPPDHYPKVPRVAMGWQVTDEVSLKGDLYYALTGSALMAGGHLDASYKSGALEAWFRVGADFLIAWKPYHYDGLMYVNVGASWHWLSIEVGVYLHIWGPDFSGEAEVDLGFTSLHLRFGASDPPGKEYIDWTTFQTSFLPLASATCTISCGRGLVRQIEASAGLAAEWVVSARELVVQVATQVPASDCTFNGSPAKPSGAQYTFGLAPMGIEPGAVSAPLLIEVNQITNGPASAQPMRLQEDLKPVPYALWGPPGAETTVGGNRPTMVAKTLGGFALRPPKLPVPSASTPLDVASLAYSDAEVRAAAPLTPPVVFKAVSLPNEVLVPGNAAYQNFVLNALGIDPSEVRPGADLATQLLHRPIQIEMGL